MSRIRYSLNKNSIDFYDGWETTTYADVDKIIISLIKQLERENQQLKDNAENLINFLENKINKCEERVEYIKTRKVLNSTPERYINEGFVWAYRDLLERAKSGKYE